MSWRQGRDCGLSKMNSLCAGHQSLQAGTKRGQQNNCKVCANGLDNKRQQVAWGKACAVVHTPCWALEKMWGWVGTSWPRRDGEESRSKEKHPNILIRKGCNFPSYKSCFGLRNKAARSQDSSINNSHSPHSSCGGQILCARKRLTLLQGEGFNCRRWLAEWLDQ